MRFAVSWRRITPDAFVWRALAHARVRANDNAAAQTITRRRLVGFCNRAPSSAGIVWNCMMKCGFAVTDARLMNGLDKACVE